ncbi:tetratricopeptide repeat-containing sensor histidine kinase [Zobellia barbeyronii]|uniref:Tetratricopeptide repeat protein n=1 Tax=Zobellia barbeyronii TaxID=2748009 RepID=A0ABS5WDR4_9FLAO|nr:tetratricopeptide repeat-containing sensor histidine kinase [Zobellia barbeyronii]MBT2160960.1 tetratricopeptide repeat protein [Zobellia barbeyronii]
MLPVTCRPLRSIKYLGFSFIALLLAFSCTQKNDQLNNAQVSIQADSAFSLIDSASNTELSVPERIAFLNTAQKRASVIENDSLKIKLFSKISFKYLILKDSSNFRKTNQQTLELAQVLNDSITIAEANWDLADFYRSKSNSDNAYFHFSEAQKVYEKLNKDYESARMLYNMAVTQADIKDYTGSEINTIKAIEILKPLEEYKRLYNCYNNLGSITKELKDFDRALDYYNTAREYQEKISEDNTLDLSIVNNIGVVYLEQGNYKKAIPYFQEVLDNKSLITKRPDLYAMALNNLAYGKSKIDQKSDLSSYFEEVIKIQDSLGEIQDISRSHYCFADYYLSRKDTTQAISQAKKALGYSKIATNNDRILKSLQLLVKIEPSKSSYYNQKYIALNDSLQQVERQARNKFARIRFETDEFIAENQLLEREKQLWTGVAISILLLGLMSYIILDQRSKNQKLRFQQQQQAANQEIFNLMLSQKEKLEEGKKIEQKRISEELHDGVLGKMLGARMVLTGLNKRTGDEIIIERKKAIDVLQDVEKEVRSISHELSHAAYQNIPNFIHSIRDLLDTVKATGHFEYEFVYNETFDWDSLDANVKINVYRMIQESLQNCVKHAACKNVIVELSKTNIGFMAKITDDGKGFKTNSRKKGIGLRNISSRIKKIKGTYTINSAPGKGTTVELEVPLEAETEHSTS